MTKPKIKQSLVLLGRRTAILLLAVILSFATLLYSLIPNIANAAQMTQRSVTISSSVGGLTGVGYDFTFSWIAGSTVNSAVFQFCDTPLGTCTLPNSMNIDPSTLTSLGGTTGFPDQATDAFSEYTGVDAGACTDHNAGAASTQFCISRNTNATTTAGTGATAAIDGVTNPTIPALQNFETVFVRVTLYSDNAFATQVHDGTVAAAIVRQLTTTGRVQERLEFCIAAITEAGWDGAFSTDANTDCADFPTTTLVDLGVIENTNPKVSPVNNSVTDPANDSFGIAMIDTNASNGVEITYFPEAQTNVSASDTDQLRSFRVIPTDCAAAATTLTDQCFQSAGAAANTITAGSEEIFGLYVACLVTATGITGGNLTVDADYDGDGTVTYAADCENEAGPYTVAFDDSGTPATLASSATVVDDEMLAIRFAAQAEATTPTGQYTVVTTYIATPTY